MALFLDLLAYMLLSFFHASWDVLAVDMVGEVDAGIALRISLSYRIQWVFWRAMDDEPVGLGHKLSPVT